MTAEFAVAVPAVIVVLAVCLGALQIAAAQIRLTAAAATAARLAGRGDSADAALVQLGAAPTASYETEYDASFVCVRLAQSLPLAFLRAAAITLTSRSCALRGDE